MICLVSVQRVVRASGQCVVVEAVGVVQSGRRSVLDAQLNLHCRWWGSNSVV